MSEKSGLVVAIDIDEVLLNFIDPFLIFHNRKYGSSFKKEDMNSYDFSKVWGGPREEAVRRVFEFYDTLEFESIEPLPYAKKAIDLLSDIHELHVVTARSSAISEQTYKQLDTFFSGKFESVRFSHNPYANIKGKTKRKHCDDLGADVFIDDGLEHALSCAERNMDVLLFDLGYPWSQNRFLPENVLRANSWMQVLGYISYFGVIKESERRFSMKNFK